MGIVLVVDTHAAGPAGREVAKQGGEVVILRERMDKRLGTAGTPPGGQDGTGRDMEHATQKLHKLSLLRPDLSRMPS